MIANNLSDITINGSVLGHLRPAILLNCAAFMDCLACSCRCPVFFTNLGADIVRPIFPTNGSMDIYEAKTDKKPRRQFRDQDPLSLEGDWKSCVKSSADGWVRCTVRGTTGWVKRNAFRSAAEYAPVEKWPFRYWLHLASTPSAGEGYHETLVAARKNPYLVKPAEFESVFFHVIFDKEGRAISPRTRQPTGDHVFVVGDAVYLAPEAPGKRNAATWIF